MVPSLVLAMNLVPIFLADVFCPVLFLLIVYLDFMLFMLVTEASSNTNGPM